MNLEKEVAKEYMDPYTAKEQNAKELWFDEESEQYNDHITLSSVVTLTQPEQYVCPNCCRLNEKSNNTCNYCQHDPNVIEDR